MTGFVAVIDANVLYGIEETDLLATMASVRLFRPHWSPEILDEVSRNLVQRPDLDPEAIERRLAHLNRALPDALRSAPSELVEAMPVTRSDRHVLALAVHVGAPTIVTENLRDFPAELCEPYNVEAISTDTFVLAQVHLRPDLVVSSVEAMAARRQRAPKSPDEIIDRLSRRLPVAMAELEMFRAS